jgi:ABC-type uncharacterized transport system YnjBCD permease subunit
MMILVMEVLLGELFSLNQVWIRWHDVGTKFHDDLCNAILVLLMEVLLSEVLRLNQVICYRYQVS